MPISEWEKEYATLSGQRTAEYTKLKETRAEVAELHNIRKCVDIALKADQPEQTRAKRHEQERWGKDGQAILLVRPMYCSISEFIETFLLFCVRYTSYDIQAGVVIFLPTENIQIFRKVQFQIAVNECLLLTEVRQNYQLPTTEIPTCYFFTFRNQNIYQ